VHLVDAPYPAQIRIRDRHHVVAIRATADADDFGVADDGQGVVTIDHRFSLGNPALPSAPSKHPRPSEQPLHLTACSRFRSPLYRSAPLPRPEALRPAAFGTMAPYGRRREPARNPVGAKTRRTR